MSESKITCNIGCGSGLIGIASVAAGAYHGYCNSRGIPITSETLDWWLTWGPTTVQAGIGAIYGVLGGGILGLATSRWNNRAERGALGSLLGAGAGSAFGAAKGGLESLVGYGLGYGVGYVMGRQ